MRWIKQKIKEIPRLWKSGILTIIAGLFLWKLLHIVKGGADDILPNIPQLAKNSWLNLGLYAIFIPVLGGLLMDGISYAMRRIAIGRGGREALLFEPVGFTGFTRKKLVVVSGETNIGGRPHWICERPHLISILTGNAEFVDKDDPFFKFTERSDKECFKSYALRFTDLPAEMIRKKNLPSDPTVKQDQPNDLAGGI